MCHDMPCLHLELGKKDFQIIQLKLYPSRDPMPFLSSAYWVAPTEKKHLTALTVNEANFICSLKRHSEDDKIDNSQQHVFPNLHS